MHKPPGSLLPKTHTLHGVSKLYTLSSCTELHEKPFLPVSLPHSPCRPPTNPLCSLDPAASPVLSHTNVLLLAYMQKCGPANLKKLHPSTLSTVFVLAG